MSTENTLTKFELGQLVVINSFPPVESINDETVINFKYYERNIPVMVIHEIFHASKLERKYDEETGLQTASNSKYKCAWYSQRDCQFHSAMFYEDQLRSLELKEETIQIPKIGDVLSYKTIQLETQKLFKKNNDSNQIKSLDFIPPSLNVKAIKKNNVPDTYDTKTGSLTNKKSSCLVKCRWYNNKSDKYSEELLPIEALVLP